MNQPEKKPLLPFRIVSVPDPDTGESVGIRTEFITPDNQLVLFYNHHDGSSAVAIFQQVELNGEIIEVPIVAQEFPSMFDQR